MDDAQCKIISQSMLGGTVFALLSAVWFHCGAYTALISMILTILIAVNALICLLIPCHKDKWYSKIYLMIQSIVVLCTFIAIGVFCYTSENTLSK